jgi:Ion channel
VGADLPPDTSLLRRHAHPDGYGYGWLLVLILISLAFQLGVPDTEWARALTIALQGLTLLAALWVARAHRRLLQGAAVLVLASVLIATGILVSSAELSSVSGRLVGLLLVVLAPVAIVLGIVRQARDAQAITIRTMFGVLCVYLLIGMAFGFGYGLIAAIEDGAFFAQIDASDQADYLYFSFATITTTGFGDLTAAEDLGRSLAITEALIGQFYLVTVVALIVSNLGLVRRSASE